jgi:UDP-glucuronate 4-epimerase
MNRYEKGDNGDMLRDFTYIDDIVEGIVKLLDHPPKPDSNRNLDPSTSHAPYKIYNIGNNSPVKLMDFINTLEQLIDKKAKIEYLPMQPGDVKETFADISDLQKAAGFSPVTPLEIGLGHFVDWYKKYHK